MTADDDVLTVETNGMTRREIYRSQNMLASPSLNSKNPDMQPAFAWYSTPVFLLPRGLWSTRPEAPMPATSRQSSFVPAVS
jgi:hypothetical protein